MPHTPALHSAVALAGTGHTTPHAPQFFGSRETTASQPLAALLSQSEYPWLQAWSWHIPAWQLSTALGATHTTPHMPQFLASEVRSCSQPLSTLPSQSPKLALHLPTPHEPPEQPGAPFITAGQRLPQPAQLLGSAMVSASQPSPAFLLQSAKPA